MWFLIKGTFWFTLVLVALSFIGTATRSPDQPEPQGFDLASAVTAASGAYQYLAQICVERPDVCQKGAETLTAVGERAREGALVAFQIIDEHLNDQKASAEKAKLADALPQPETAAELEQPMPPMPPAAGKPLVTGSVKTTETVPVPLAKPSLR